MRKLDIEFVGDVITQPLSACACLNEFETSLTHHDIDQHMQVLLSDHNPDVLICHTLFSYFCPSPNADPTERVTEYCTTISDFLSKNNTLLIVNTVSAPAGRIVGMDYLSNRQKEAEINRQLYDLAVQCNMISVADIAGAITKIGSSRALSIQNDLVMRMPYTKAVIPEINKEYNRVIRERFVARKKALVLDADNTLWGGVIGEDGPNGIEVSDQFPGNMYRLFQLQLLELKKSGIVLTLSTKNNEGDVIEAFNKIDMPLSIDDFSVVKANWNPKSSNIQSISEELNIGLDSMVFIDDNPFELEEVRAALPMVDAHQFHFKKADSALGLLQSIPDLNIWSITDEDKTKSQQYAQEKSRTKIRESVNSIEDYIRSLEINIQIGINRSTEIKRISQLTNKTNQFNLTTKRYSEAEMLEAMDEGKVFDFRVIDKFGDMGIVGVSVVRDSKVEAFLMSCRALGRQIEGHMLGYICEEMQDDNLKSAYIRTAKNDMVSNFYEHNGFKCLKQDSTTKHYQLNQVVARSMNFPITRVD